MEIPLRPHDTKTESPSMLTTLVRERRLLMILPLVFLAAGVVYILVRDPRYVAESRVRPLTNQNNTNRFAGLAAQFGITVPNISDPIKLYAEIGHSHRVLSRLLQTPFENPETPGQQVALIDLLEIEGKTPQRRIREGVDELRERVEVTPNDLTGTLRIRVTTPWPQLSEAVNAEFLTLVDSASMLVRQGQASSERQFISARLAEAQAQLGAAERALEAFRRTNRSYDNAPSLSAEAERLERQVDFRQQVAISLAQNYEQARVDEVRNTPVLGVIDPPQGTAIPANRLRDIVIWPLAGLVLAFAIALGKEATRRSASRHPGEWAQIRSLLRLEGLRRRSA